MTGKASIARVIALQTLERIFSKRPEKADESLDLLIRQYAVSSRDAALAFELVMGVTKNLNLLDFYIEPFLTRKITRTPPVILHILRMALHQKLNLERIPDFAIVNESVKLARQKCGTKAANFVNAFLRAFLAQEKPRALPPRSQDINRYLSIRYSFPEWIVGMFRAIMGEHDVEWFMAASNSTPPIDFRINPLKTTRADVVNLLRESGFTKVEETPYSPVGVRVKEAAALLIKSTGILDNGLVSVQDESAQLIAYLMEPRPGEKIIDFCAAPGGKSTHLAELSRDSAQIYALDINESRLQLVVENSRRLGLHSITTLPLTAKALYELRDFRADKILVDAPCTALGTLRRNPEIRWIRKPGDLRRMADIQIDICSRALAHLKPDGVLVYSVCTLSHDETIEVINNLLAMFPGLMIESPMIYIPGIPADMISRAGCMVSLTHRHNTDTFFAARMRLCK